MKRIIIFLIIITGFVGFYSCKSEVKEKEHIKKRELNRETIAVGIYKANDVEYANAEYIAEALKTDAGIVYVTLRDADILKTKLENIDVIVFPGIANTKDYDIPDTQISEIFRSFIFDRGKGAIGISTGVVTLLKISEMQSVKLMDVSETKESRIFPEALLQFQLTETGNSIFPELINNDSLFVHSVFNPYVSIDSTMKNDYEIVGFKNVNELVQPFFITSNRGKGKIFMSFVNPESTPGMRWMIPRMVRWVYSKELVSYQANLIKPNLYTKEIIFTDDLIQKLNSLISVLETGDTDEKEDAINKLKEIYPWVAHDEVRKMLLEKDDDLKLQAARYLVEIEYTRAIDDLKLAIKIERNRKVKEQLADLQLKLENMLEQN